MLYEVITNFAGGTEEALDSVMQAITKAGYEPGKDVTIALDCAASEFFKDGIYDYSKFEGPNGVITSYSIHYTKLYEKV